MTSSSLNSLKNGEPKQMKPPVRSDILHGSASHTLPKASGLMNLGGSSVSQHPTHHVSVLLIPHIVTHRPPAVLMENLYTAFVRTGPVYQPHNRLLHCKTHTNTQKYKNLCKQIQKLLVFRLFKNTTLFYQALKKIYFIVGVYEFNEPRKSN